MDRRSLPVLVTGAASGIGRAAAFEVARRGYRTVATTRTDDQAAGLAADAEAAGVRLETAAFDVTDAGRAKELVADVDPYAVVSAAGYTNMGAVEDVTDEEARHQLETMVLAPIRLARLALPGMRARGGGRIVTIGSILGHMTTPLMGWYDGSKHAVEAIHDALRIEVRSAGIRVTLVDPGAVDTPIYAKAWAELEARSPSRYADAYRRWTGVTRRALPVFTPAERVAAAVADVVGSPNPPARRWVGLGAPLAPVGFRLVPPFVRDRAFRALLRL
jgi:NAD(P)-dependent dehydrogenase (short-subunit alcohol dehydrogenase family)